MFRAFRAIVVGLVLALGLVWAAIWFVGIEPDAAVSGMIRRVAAMVGMAPVVSGGGSGFGALVGGPFSLTDDRGQAVTQADYRGRWMLIYFGYSYCPDVCPTELQTIAGTLDKLGADAAKIVPLFITIDPERDTPRVLADYVKLFDDRIIGLTGTPSQIADVARAYRVYYAKAASKGTASYLMDHSSMVYLVNPQGVFVALFGQDTSAPELAAAIGRRIGQSG